MAERVFGEVEACHPRPAPGEAERVEPDVALEVEDVEAGDVPDFGRLDRMEDVLAGEKRPDRVGAGLVLDMDVGALVPVGPIGVEIGGHGGGL